MKLVKPNDIPDKMVDTPEDLFEVYKVCKQMQLLCEKEQGAGLSAVQVGIPWKLFVIRGFKKYRNFLDCKYEGIGEKDLQSVEGCLSLKNSDGSLRHFKVLRYHEIRVVGFELLENEKLEKVAVDFIVKSPEISSIVFQHEIDHHFNILISDIGQEFNVWKA